MAPDFKLRNYRLDAYRLITVVAVAVILLLAGSLAGVLSQLSQANQTIDELRLERAAYLDQSALIRQLEVRVSHAEIVAKGWEHEAALMRTRWENAAYRDWEARSKLDRLYFFLFEKAPMPRLLDDRTNSGSSAK